MVICPNCYHVCQDSDEVCLFCKHPVPENDLHLDEGGDPLVPDMVPDKAEPWLMVVSVMVSVILIWFIGKHFVLAHFVA